MKIVIAGNWHSAIHEEPVYRALRQLGQEVVRFPWHQYFTPPDSVLPLALPLFKAQNKFILGPLVSKLNRDLITRVSQQRPDVLFIYRGTHIYPETLRKIKKISPSTILVGYNNDDPFSPAWPRWMWRHFVAGLPVYDLVLTYRHHNLEDFTKAGARRVSLFRSWFLPYLHRPLTLSRSQLQRYGCDVVFIGHYENDGRLAAIEALVRAGFHVRVFGPYKGLGSEGWHGRIDKSPILRTMAPTRYLNGTEYVAALCGAKIGLCFLSKKNRDTYTRRCFEIPACGTALFSEYTDDLASIFVEGQDAEFFRSKNELVEKVSYYLANPGLLDKLRTRGLLRVHKDGHDVVSRMRKLLEILC